ncbi:ankyrin repeat domain-containing protein [Cupriavidus malaysiensis]|uniref:ankyrin repeat domain-containing protein n=1 Tax=Cupriavidus malaysiensis TaxID=367825 RepID=UPI000A04ACCF|nr:ankyrin repeat domain-containing protein [Cupriavidus malaysiensis]
MPRAAVRSRSLMLAEVLGLAGLLMGSGLIASPGGSSQAARAPASAAPAGLHAAPALNHHPLRGGISTLDRNLITASAAGDLELVTRLLTAGASAQAVDERGRSALLASIYGQHKEVARVLILAGADVNRKDGEANSPFLQSASSGQADLVRLEIAHGADLRSTDRYDGTALIAASEHGHVDVVKLLLQAGVPVDHVNQLGWTALLEAIILGDGSQRYEDIVQLLLDAGADPNLADREGNTPTRHARERGYKTIVKSLMRVRGH